MKQDIKITLEEIRLQLQGARKDYSNRLLGLRLQKKVIEEMEEIEEEILREEPLDNTEIEIKEIIDEDGDNV